MIGSVINNNDFIVYESTVYPGVTEEICVKIIEKKSGLKVINDKYQKKGFYCGYSPERINPGDKVKTVENITKIVSGSNLYATKIIKSVYQRVTKKIFVSSSIKVAEAAKVIENSQRDINIAFINELSLIFNKLNISFNEVLKAASTKWNFINFTPGLVGGHCIGVDPYYLSYKSKQVGYTPKVLLAGRKINDDMSKIFAKNFIKILKKKTLNKNKFNILILGLSFKEDVKDLRNSKIFETIDFLKKNHNVRIYDPTINVFDLNIKYQKLTTTLNEKNFYDGVFLATPHSIFLKNSFFLKLQKSCKKIYLIYDIKHRIKSNLKKFPVITS